MEPDPDWRAALGQFTDELKLLYGKRLEGLVLYGSRARGDADPLSDIDLLVLLPPGMDFWTEFRRIAPVADRLSLEHGVVISAIPADSREYRSAAKPLYMNARREGRQVA